MNSAQTAGEALVGVLHVDEVSPRVSVVASAAALAVVAQAVAAQAAAFQADASQVAASFYYCSDLQPASDMYPAPTAVEALSVEGALAVQVAAAHSTVVDHGTSAYGTAIQQARHTNSTEIQNADGVSPSDRQAVVKVLNVEWGFDAT